jgi:hypothetical protein
MNNPHNLPKQSPDELRALARELLAQHRAGCRHTRQLDQALYKSLAGDYLPDLLKNPEAYLLSQEPKLRMAALSVLRSTYWRAGKEVGGKCEAMFFRDPDQEVRAVALVVLGSIYSHTNDPKAGKLFAGIVKDDSRPLKLRRTAYNNLFLLRGVQAMSLPLISELLGGARFPENVDWHFVNSFFDGREKKAENK